MTSSNLYSAFVSSEIWTETIEQIRKINPIVAEEINKTGIGSKLLDNGDYDYESGQLLDDLSSQFKREHEEEIEKVYDLIICLAEAYSTFAKTKLLTT